MKTSIFILLIIIFFGCSGKGDKYYFNGEISVVTDTATIVKLQGKEISTDVLYFKIFSVYDTLLFYQNMQPHKSFIEVYNIKDGTFLGDFCNKGNGPKEFNCIPPINQFYIENNKLKTILFPFNNKKLVVWDITESLNSKTNVFDTIVPYDWSEEHISIYNYIFRLNKDTILTHIPSVSLDGGKVSLPVLQKRTISSNKKIQDYTIFNNQIENGNKNMAADVYFMCANCLKPDRKKVAQGMLYLPQINIIDLITGEIKGFRLDKNTDFSVFEKSNAQIPYGYHRVYGDDYYIYALYSGDIYYPKDEWIPPHILHVFDWDGNLVRKFDLDHNVHEMQIDPANRNLLYTMNMDEQKIYCYHLNE